ncbi:MAG: helix-turn-helix transcriptional regulator [Sphingobacteriales bacterium]|nr:helix-turn-helix transcriptional regulator [Sphingobacteriales bacterium]
MRSSVAKRILERTSPETKQFARKYGELVNRIHQALKEKNWTQKDLAVAMDKQPSEISKWLSGEHNLTFKSIVKLEHELGIELLYIPKTVSFEMHTETKVQMTVVRNQPVEKLTGFVPAQKYVYKEKTA